MSWKLLPLVGQWYYSFQGHILEIPAPKKLNLIGKNGSYRHYRLDWKDIARKFSQSKIFQCLRKYILAAHEIKVIVNRRLWSRRSACCRWSVKWTTWRLPGGEIKRLIIKIHQSLDWSNLLLHAQQWLFRYSHDARSINSWLAYRL